MDGPVSGRESVRRVRAVLPLDRSLRSDPNDASMVFRTRTALAWTISKMVQNCVPRDAAEFVLAFHRVGYACAARSDHVHGRGVVDLRASAIVHTDRGSGQARIGHLSAWDIEMD